MSTDELKRRDGVLLKVKEELKKQFVGIDRVIDQIVDSVRVWYVMPELMMRPVIVNLWGLTGTGKTSLVRSFVKLINMTDSFIEIQMDTGNDYYTIRDFIERSEIQQDTPSILLLDEIQRFRTIDGNGVELTGKKAFQDVWMLLSDGKFQSSSDKKSELMRMILDKMYYDDSRTKKNADDEDTPKELKYKRYYSSAYSIKRLVNASESVEEIMTWSDEKRIEVFKNAVKDNQTYEGATYAKMLIFISGNIDEAYRMSSDVNDADTDADIFHEFSKKINIINIKKALATRFKPEQIARFGNIHVIYPSLSKRSYQEIIRQNIMKFCDSVRARHTIKIMVDDSVYHTIYDNGVFPAQGVRPVLSTLTSIFENYIPIFLLKALEEKTAVVKVKYVNSNIVGEINGEEISIAVELSIDKIKKDKNRSENVCTSVHEAGHAIVYSLLYKLTPTQIKSSTSDMNKDGFIGIHMMHLSKRYVQDTIVVALAGQAAEEIVFGEEFKSAGASSDIIQATRMAANYVRAYAFDGIQCRVVPEVHQSAVEANTDFDKTNSIIEGLLVEGKKKALDLLNGNMGYFKEVIQLLIDQGEVSPAELKSIAEKYGISIINCPSDVKLINNYDDKWRQFKGQSK
jgi:cell division protease FtsH